MLLSLILTPAFADPADDRFFPDEGGRMLSLQSLIDQGSALGRTGRLLLALRDRADLPALLAIPGVAQVTPLRGEVISLRLQPGTDDLDLARRLHADPRVAWVHPDLLLPIRLDSAPDDPMLSGEWHIEHIDAPLAWDFASGAGQIIAVVDSGVQTDHPDLRVLPGVDLLDDDTDPTPSDGNGHGTCVAGVAAGMGDNAYGTAGLAWGAEVYPVRLIGGATSNQDVYDAITGSVDAGASVINNSWGYGSGCPVIAMNRTFTSMFEYAEAQGRGGLGSVVTFAAGNENCDIVDNEFLATPTLIVVAAVERDDERAGYSSYGDSVDIAAPTGLLAADMIPGGYGSYEEDDAFADGFGGTSAATPVVSGVVALMISANPRLTAAQIREVICQTATRIDLPLAGYDADGHSPWYGCGLIDAGAAVASVANAPPGVPIPTLPAGAAYEGRILLAWEAAADADGDILGYDVAWEVDGAETVERVAGLSADLSAAGIGIGDIMTWRVRAVDTWGAGEWSEERQFSYEEAPVEVTVEVEKVEPTACAYGGAGAGWGLAGIIFARLRRRA